MSDITDNLTFVKQSLQTDDVKNVDIAKLQDTIKIKDQIDEIEEYFSDLL